MASLTHVCVWSSKGWTHITPEEVARSHPGGSVSARSGLFMCELCGQYVRFVDGDIQTPHFRHSAYEESKIVRSVHLVREETIPMWLVNMNFPSELSILQARAFHLSWDWLRFQENF